MASVGDRIRQERERQNLTISELARLSRVSKGYLWQIEESAKTRPSAVTLDKVAEALGTSVAALLGSESGESERGEPELPPGLKEFAEEEGLPAAELQMLAGIRYRGAPPATKEDWRFIYDSIRRSVRGR